MERINMQTKYSEFIDELFKNQDDNYQKFHQKLVKNNNVCIIGVRTPKLQEIAKEISKNDIDFFIKGNKHKYYEETLIHGLIIGYKKMPIEKTFAYLDNFIPLVDNWATCDLVCANLKVFKKEQTLGIKYIKKNLSSKNPWIIRFMIVLLLDHFINDHYIDKILDIVRTIKNEEYYVKMALAWLISICYIKYPIKTEILFKENILDPWTLNKSISKITDSKRVSIEIKTYLKTLKK